MKTRDLVIETLKQIGCQPEIDDKDNICFKYQGESFFVSADNNIKFITIWDPWWFAMDLRNPDVIPLKEAINLINNNMPLVHVIYSVDQKGGRIGIHSRCDSLFIEEVPLLNDLMKSLLEHFFNRTQSLETSVQPTEESPERTIKLKNNIHNSYTEYS